MPYPDGRINGISFLHFQGAKPDAGRFLNFDHVEWWVGNAKMAAAHYCARLGFDYFAYKVQLRLARTS